MDSGIFAITFDRNKVEIWGFHHSIEDSLEHRHTSNPIGEYIDQSGEFLDKHYCGTILKISFYYDFNL